jgi:mono/diheme cytochrome c family protein
MRKSTSLLIVLALMLLGTWFVACGSAGGEAATPLAATTATATTEITRITDATPPATYVWKQPTTIIQIEDTPTPAASSSEDQKMIDRGKALYEKQECGNCHGQNAEGIDGKGSKLAATSLTEEEFRDVLRTGGQGELGNEHLYGTSAISESGITAIYMFLQSLE